MDLDTYTNNIFDLLKDSPSETIAIGTVNELVNLYLFVRNADQAVGGTIAPPVSDIPKNALKTTLSSVDNEIARQETDFAASIAAAAEAGAALPLFNPMPTLAVGELSLIFNKINNADINITKNNIKTLVNNGAVADPIIDASVTLTTEDELVALINRIRDAIVAGTMLPPPPGPAVVTSPVAPKMYTFYAHENGRDGIDIFAENTDPTVMTNILATKGADFITIPSMNPRIEAIAETLLHKDTLLRQPIQFKTPDDIRLLTDSYIGTKDAVLGTGWSSFFRSPVFMKDVMTPVIGSAAPIKIPIYYYDRKPASIDSANNVTLYQKAHTTNSSPALSAPISNIARLDTFIENINKIAKMELKDGDPIYLINIEQSPFIKSATAAFASTDQCQYLSINIEPSTYSSNTPKWGNAKTACTSPLPAGPLYKYQFDALVADFLVFPDPTTSPGGSGSAVGGSMNKYTRKFMEPVMYHTRHRRRRVSRANMKRKRYNKTRKG